MNKFLTILTVVLSFNFSTILSANAAPATPESVRVLMEKTGAAKMSYQMMEQMMPMVQQMLPQVPQSFWNEFMKQAKGDDLLNMLIPVYQKHLTESDVQELNRFFSTPVGQKMISVQPAIMQESMMIGQQWGQAIAQKALMQFQQQQNSQQSAK